MHLTRDQYQKEIKEELQQSSQIFSNRLNFFLCELGNSLKPNFKSKKESTEYEINIENDISQNDQTDKNNKDVSEIKSDIPSNMHDIYNPNFSGPLPRSQFETDQSSLGILLNS